MKLKKYFNSKNFSKILALGIFISSMPINSFASILSDDGRYETFEDNNITINNILEEDKVDVEIEGSTLVNLLGKDNYKGNINVLYQNLGLSALTVKAGQEYTFITNTNIPYHLKYVNDNSICLVFEKGKYKAKFTANQDSKMMLIATTSSGEYNVDGLLLEGDWTNKEMPLYFEGLKSVGEQLNGNHKIEILSKNKNLFNINDFNFDSVCSGVSLRIEGQEIILNGTSTSSYTRHSLNNYLDYMKDKTTYTLSGDYMLMETTYKDGRQTWTKQITTDKSNMERVTVYLQWLQPNVVFNNLRIRPMLEEGSTATTYATPSLNKKEIQLNEPLRGLPNGTRDRIVKRNGKWYIERNCSEIILDGSEKMIVETINGINYYCPKTITSSIIYTDITPVSDKFITTIPRVGTSDVYTRCLYIATNGRIFIKDASFVNAYDLQAWLQLNPVTVVYPLDVPVYELINFDSLSLYLDTTHISIDSNIPANIKVTVDRVANRAKEYSEIAKENPTIENISLARMWINSMRESILKDTLQYSIDNITEVTNMTLERKTASANLDLYIKSENILSMSLDTNTITFEDFSGVEDMTKDSAVNISINSSLPYNLNAYLPTEIQNSDKSNSMNLDILSIKENSELNYQKFTAINNKLILKSNCESGNYKLHNIDLKLNAGVAHENDVYKTTIKFEAEQI